MNSLSDRGRREASRLISELVKVDSVIAPDGSPLNTSRAVFRPVLGGRSGRHMGRWCPDLVAARLL